MGGLGRLGGQGLIVELPGRLRIEGEVELVVPAKLEPGLAQGVVPILSAGVALGQVGRVGGDLVGDHPGLDVVSIGQAEVLFGGDVAEHGAAVAADHRGADGRGDVVVARSDVRGQGPQRVKRRLVAVLELLGHVLFDLVHGHVARTLDHDLDIVLPRDLGELPQGPQLAELGLVVGVGDRSWAQAVAQREGHVVALHELADALELGVEEVLLVVRQAPLGHDRSAAGDDARDPLGGHGDVAQQHAGVDREVVHALLGLLLEGLHEHVDVQVFGLALDLLERLVDRHGADRDRRVADDPLAGLVDVRAGREVHDRVRSPARAPLELLDLLLDGRGDRRVADVGVDLDQEIAADDHRLELRVVDVRWDHSATKGDLFTHVVGVDVLPDRHEAHLFGNDAAASEVHLTPVGAALALLLGELSATVEPRLAALGEAVSRVDTLGARGVVDLEGRVVAAEADPPCRYAQRAQTDLLGIGEAVLERRHGAHRGDVVTGDLQACGAAWGFV